MNSSPWLSTRTLTSAGAARLLAPVARGYALAREISASTLDDWWPEAYKSEIGWALGDGFEALDDAAHDTAEPEALYVLLEVKVIAEFYECDDNSIPAAWVARMCESMARLNHRGARVHPCTRRELRMNVPLGSNGI